MLETTMDHEHLAVFSEQRLLFCEPLHLFSQQPLAPLSENPSQAAVLQPCTQPCVQPCIQPCVPSCFSVALLSSFCCPLFSSSCPPVAFFSLSPAFSIVSGVLACSELRTFFFLLPTGSTHESGRDCTKDTMGASVDVSRVIDCATSSPARQHGGILLKLISKVKSFMRAVMSLVGLLDAADVCSKFKDL